MKTKMKGTAVSMTEGSPAGLILRFTLPMMVGSIFQQLYSLVDAIVVGRFVGSTELGGISCAGSIDFIIFSLGTGIAAGLGVLIAILVGARDQERLTKAIYNGLYTLLGTAAVVTVIGFFGSGTFLTWMNTPTENFPHAHTYLRIVMAGSAAPILYNGVSSVMRSFGDSKTPLVILIFACLMNVALDLLLVLVFHMGVAGVAIATIIAQGSSALLGIFFALKNIPEFRPRKGCMGLDRHLLGKTVRLGLPMAAQNMLIALSCAVLQTVVNGFGQMVVAANMAVSKVEQLVHQPYNALSTALSTFTGQNIGAAKPHRVKQGLRFSTMCMLAFSALMIAVMFLFGHPIMTLFVEEEEILSIGATALKITSVFYPFLGLIYMYRGVLNGAGDVTFCAMYGIIELVCRTCMAAPLTKIPGVGMWGVFLCTGLTWAFTGVLCALRYRSGKWLAIHNLDKPIQSE